MNQILELSGKDFEAAIIKILPQAIKNSLETNVKIKNLTKEMEFIFNGN